MKFVLVQIMKLLGMEKKIPDFVDKYHLNCRFSHEESEQGDPCLPKFHVLDLEGRSQIQRN